MAVLRKIAIEEGIALTRPHKHLEEAKHPAQTQTQTQTQPQPQPAQHSHVADLIRNVSDVVMTATAVKSRSKLNHQHKLAVAQECSKKIEVLLHASYARISCNCIIIVVKYYGGVYRIMRKKDSSS